MIIIYLSCEVGLAISVHFQYQRDYYLFHLARFKASRLFAVSSQGQLLREGAQTIGLSYRQVLAVEEELRLR